MKSIYNYPSLAGPWCDVVYRATLAYRVGVDLHLLRVRILPDAAKSNPMKLFAVFFSKRLEVQCEILRVYATLLSTVVTIIGCFNL